MRLGFLSSHPIQYQAPLFRELAQRPGVAVTALFCHDHGVRPTWDVEFRKTIQFDVPLLDGYDHRFLRNVSPWPSLSPGGLINPGILSSLVRNEFDALVVHGYGHLSTLMGLLGPRSRTRVLLRGDSNLRAKRGLGKRILKHVTLRPLFARVDHFLAIGTWNREYYEAYGVPKARITLAPFSVDNAYFESRSAEARQDPVSVRRRLGLPETGVLFVFCAKLVPKKRPLDALEAFARVRRKIPCGLVFIGDGLLAPDVRTRSMQLGVGDDVVLLGFRNQSELPPIYGASDVLVLPSDQEPWGLVANEAAACGMGRLFSDQVAAGADLSHPSRIFRAGSIDDLVSLMSLLARDGGALTEAKRDATTRIRHWGLRETADGILRGVSTAIQGGG